MEVTNKISSKKSNEPAKLLSLTNLHSKSKVTQSLYTPWTRLGGEEV
jgi:hypothetical protein